MSSVTTRTKQVALALLAVAAIGVVAASLLTRGAWNSTDEPLPQGPISAPDFSTQDAKSEFRAIVRLGLDTFGSMIKKRPITTKIGKVNVSEIALSQLDESQIKLKKATATFNGELEYLGIPVKSATIDLAGTVLRPQVDDEWVLQGNPDVRARVSDSDVRSWVISDKVAEIAINNNFLFVNPNKWLRSDIADRIRLPLGKSIELYWSRLSTHTGLSVFGSPITGTVCLRPTDAFVAPPIVEDAQRRLRIDIGIDFESFLTVAETHSPTRAPAAPLPKPKLLPRADRLESRLRLPIVARVSDLSAFWKPCPVPGVAGDFRIEALDLAEKEGVLHGRMHFAFQRATGWSPFLPRDVKGTVHFQAIPTCDAERGRLGVSGFSFTEKSNSLLIDLIGAKANGVIRTAIEEAVPVLSGDLFRQAEAAATTHVNDMLANGIDRWAESVPAYSDELKRAKAEVSPIVLKPTAVTVKNGHLIVTLQADAVIVVEMRDAAAMPASAANGPDDPAS